MACKFCNREISNVGAAAAHEKSCQLNPNRVAPRRSPNAGRQAGYISPLKGTTKTEENLEYTRQIIESGEFENLSEPMARKHAKRHLLALNGHKCEMCNTTEWLGQPIPLVCDHIDGDSTNNQLSNFRLICNNCDATLPTYKSRNRGRGREYDRNRYHQK